MKVIARPMGSGKTEELLRSAAEDKALVLAENKTDLQAKANAYGITVQVIDWDDLIENVYDENTKIYIHKLDDFVKYWLWEDYKLQLTGYSIRTEGMDRYDYRKVIKNEIIDWIISNTDLMENKESLYDDEISNWIYDEVFAEDSVTGNGPYGYAREEQCREYVASNLDLYFEAAREFDDFPTGTTPWTVRNPAQHMDATIRCYLLGECIENALEELRK